MKKYIYGALIGIILAALLLRGANSSGAPFFTYVYSNSMEPLIKVNDAFLVWPTSNVRVGDIIMYRPVVLKAAYITHRIIAAGDSGYITKGDNAYYKDQDSGEPQVAKDRIMGRVVTINGQPVIIPQIGKFTAFVRSGLGKYTIYLAMAFFILGIILLIGGGKGSLQKRRPRNRLRLRHIYGGASKLAAIIIILTIYFSSRVSQINYLVSEYPGTLGDQIGVNQPGVLTMNIKNNGLIPVWKVMRGIPPLSIRDTSLYVKPLSSKTILIDVTAQHRTGAYQGYIQIYSYPALLPKEGILFLHSIHPLAAIASVGLWVYLLFCACFWLLQQLHGFEAWIPLKTIEDKIMRRRMERGLGKLIGRRRSK